MRVDDNLNNIWCRLHRLNDGWTIILFGYTKIALLMTPQALIWKIHFAELIVDLLEDIALIYTLQSSIEITDEIKQTLEYPEIMMKKIDDTRE